MPKQSADILALRGPLYQHYIWLRQWAAMSLPTSSHHGHKSAAYNLASRLEVVAKAAQLTRDLAASARWTDAQATRHPLAPSIPPYPSLHNMVSAYPGRMEPPILCPLWGPCILNVAKVELPWTGKAVCKG